jgi:dienelactone hydrolase
MRYSSVARTALSFVLLGSAAALAQPPGITFEMINRQLPLEGAPLAVAGPYMTTQEAAFESPRHILFRPSDLSAFPAQDTLPVVVWGNGGCAIENRQYDGFHSTLASQGFLVLTTVRIESDPQPQQGQRGGGRSQNVDDLLAAVSWAESENKRAGSPLQGKIDTEHVAVMGSSCGGFLSVAAGADPRVDSIGVFNSGVSAPVAGAPAGGNATTDALSDVHGPVMFINGGEVDFMYAQSRANFDMVNVPAFYGARENAGHTATFYHPGGGEFANVAVNWLKYQFKGDAEAGKMFVGDDCGLCVLSTWETASKGLE